MGSEGGRMPSDEGISLELDGNAAVLTLRNPGRRNAFTREMRRELAARFNELQLRSSVRAIILTGADGHFCAGADVSKFGALDFGPLEARETYREALTLARAVADGTKPVICAIEGDCNAAGLALALLGDFMIVSRTARLGAFFARLGVLPDTGMMYTMQQRIGLARTRRMLMLAEAVSGEEAAHIGLADALVEPGETLTVAKQWAARFDDVAPMVVGWIRVALRNGIHSLDDAFRAELDLQPYLSCSADLREGIQAFLAKRPPQFSGR